MQYRISGHAQDELIIRNIPRALLDSTMQDPEQIIDEAPGKKVYQSRVEIDGRTYLLRAVVATEADPILVVTVYRTSKIERYWRKP